MLPPSSTEMSSGPRRATKVAPPAADLPPLLNQTPASANMRMTAAIRQRGCRLMRFKKLICFDIRDLLPPSVVFDVKYSHVDPKLQPGNGVPHERLRALVLGVDQIILRIHLVLGLGAAQFGQEVLLLDTALGDFHAHLANLIVSFGLVQRPPAIAHLQLDFALLLFQ